MAENFGTGVSFVDDPSGYNYDTVIFQKGKPPLDTELNLIQQIQSDQARRRLSSFPSGWLTYRPYYTSSLLKNQFYTQDPSTAIPEYALVNGAVIDVVNTNTSTPNANLIDLPAAPTSASQVNAVFLETWRALLSPNSSTNKPDPFTQLDSFRDIYAFSTNLAWAVGDNGLIINTENGGDTWSIQAINTKYQLNSVHFITASIGWIAGNNGIIARSSTGGQLWNILTTNTVENLSCVYSVSQLVAWAVGSFGTIIKTTNGISWSAQASGVTANLNSAYFLDTQNGWAVGDSGTILRTTDGGSHWLPQISGTTEKLNSVFFYDLQTGFAVGTNGTILATKTGGATWYAQSNNVGGSNAGSLAVEYTDVTMTPELDQYVDGEDVSSQANGVNKVFTVLNNPITIGDGNGTVTNLPSSVVVKVNGTAVLVDNVDGLNGQIVLHSAPVTCAAVKVYYWYKIDTSLFRGKAWITGKAGTIPAGTTSGIVLRSDDTGMTWTIQDPNTGYDINAVFMTSQLKGWVVGQFSIIRHTTDGGVTWSTQDPHIANRVIQRIFNEGNVNTTIYLNDDSIHPDAGVETTKRVQQQYKIRVVNDVDPFNFPEAGLGSQIVLSMGPNTSGQFTYENMGPVNGDYGLWRAKCPNTVDGYSYAIPMFFVARRNSAAFNTLTNANGSSTSTSVRPDLLTSDNVVRTDILDIRRQIAVPSTSELLNGNFEALMDNRLETRFYRETGGGDRYGTQILQIDRIGGNANTDGGTPINMALSDVATGLNSEVILGVVPHTDIPDASNVLPAWSSSLINGLFHQNPANYSAVYNSLTPSVNGKAVPGTFSGFGTDTITFTYKPSTYTKSQDANLQSYDFKADWIQTDTTAVLNKIPSEPKLVKNYNSNTQESYYYQGVFEHETSGRIINQWDSSISTHVNYVVAYPILSSDSSMTIASSMELHYFFRADSSNMVDSTTISLNTSNFQYPVGAVTKINNVTAGFSYKIQNVTTANPVVITTEPGYNFIPGSVYELVGMIKTAQGVTNSGATVNFKRAEKKLDMFCVSDILTSTVVVSSNVPVTLSLIANGSLPWDVGITGKIVGVSNTERKPAVSGESGLILPFCWVDNGFGNKLYPIKINDYPTPDTIKITIYNFDGTPYSSSSLTVAVSLQVLVNQTNLFYTSTNAGMLIGYYYKPYQSVSELPSSLAIRMVEKPTDVIVSDLGTGGSFLTKEPFDQPLSNIPVNDSLITDDNKFYNVEPMIFSNFSVDGGLVKLNAYIPGNTGGEFVLTVPALDFQKRSFYSICSNEFTFRAEDIKNASPRKIFNALLGRVSSSSDTRFIRGEYVMIVFSRNDFLGLENYTGYIPNDKSVIAVYRLPNRPIVRV